MPTAPLLRLGADLPPQYRLLQQQLALDDGLPYTPNWSAAADFLALIHQAVLEQKPRTILECGSGLTTLILAHALAASGHGGRLMSLEQEPLYAERSRQALRHYRLEGVATVADTPLTTYWLEEKPWLWYDYRAVLPAEPMDLLIIDGPPQSIQRHARLPVLPLLYGQLAAGAHLYLDDADRPDELEVVARWQMLYPALVWESLPLERGCGHGVMASHYSEHTL